VLRLPPQVERGILKRLLEGATYREAAREFAVSTASVHRVFEDARERMADVDSLRELSILLRKAGWTVFDATRSCRLMEALSKWDVSLNELDCYVTLNERFLSERGLDETFLSYALKLMQLEQDSGRTYQEVVKDCEEKEKAATEAETRKLTLNDECFRIKAESKEAGDKLAIVKSEIETATTARRGITEIGLNKLSRLVKFIQDFEAIGYDANQARTLALWRRQLQGFHIDPDELDKFIAEKGTLEAQNNGLRLATERIKADVQTNEDRRANLVDQNTALQALDQILRTGILTMQCKSCGHSVPIWLPTRESFLNLISTGQVLVFQCEYCGTPQSFTPFDIAFQIAWMILRQA
jgi:hypothetical protein